MILGPGTGLVEVIFDGLPGHTYRVQVTDSLTLHAWEDVTTLTADQFGTYVYVGQVTSDRPARYYRSVSP